MPRPARVVLAAAVLIALGAALLLRPTTRARTRPMDNPSTIQAAPAGASAGANGPAAAEYTARARRPTPQPTPESSDPNLGSLHVRVTFANPAEWEATPSVRLRHTGTQTLHSRSLALGSDHSVLFEALTPGRVVVSVAQRVSAMVHIRAGETGRLVLHIPSGLLVVGRVVDPLGRGVEQASLWLSGDPTHPEAATKVGSSGTGGSFRLADVVHGSAIVARSPRHQSSPLHVLASAGSEAPSLTLMLGPPAGVLRGRVLDGAGRGIEAALVFAGIRLDDLLGLPPADSLEGVDAPCTATTAADGSFELEGLAADREHPLWFGKHGFAVTRVLCRPDRTEGELLITLVPEAVLEGVVVDAAGYPAAEVNLWCISRLFTSVSSNFSGPAWAAECVYTDSSGAFRLGMLHPGPGLLRARRDAQMADIEVNLESGPPSFLRVVLGSDLETPARKLRGVVQDATGRPVALARVVVTSADASLTSAFSDELGAFELRDAPLKAHVLKVYDGRCDWPYPAISRAAGPIWPWLLIRLPYADLSLGLRGRVPPSTGRVLIELSRGTLMHRFEVGVSSATGEFTSGPLPPGAYRLRAELPSAGAIDLGSIVLTGGASLNLGALVPTAYGRLQVSLDTAPRSAPVQVYLTPTHGGRVRPLTIESDAGVLEQLPVGSYTLSLWDPQFAFETRPVTIASDRTTRVHLTPQTGQLIQFHMADRGEPLSMLRFVWKDAQAQRVLWDMGTLPWRRSQLERLDLRFLPGLYSLEVFDASGKRSLTAFQAEARAEPAIVQEAAP